MITKGYDPRPGLCDPGTTIASGDAFATDGSGYHMFATYCDSCNNPSATVYAPDGTLVSTYRSPDTNIPRDTNGNYFTQDSSGNVIDTLGRTPVTTTQAGNYFYTTSGTINYDVLDSQGNTQRYSFVTQTINVNTNFGQSGLTEYSGTITVIQEIDLPDGTKYQFSYDSGTSSGHYGLLTSMTLPTGAQISYTYANFSDVYTSVYRWISSRTTSGTGITGGTWYYTPQVNGTCPGYGVNCQQQTTVTTPSGDATVYVFNLNGGPWATQVQHYSGSASSGTLLATTNQTFDYGNSCPAIESCISNVL